MDPNSAEFPPKSQQFEEQTTAESNPNADDSENADFFPLGRLQEIEDQLSQLVSTGIQDTSLMRSAESCSQVWEHAKKLSPDPHGDGPEADARLKSVVRALGEGSVLPLRDLVASLRICIQHFCDFGPDLDLSADRLQKLAPVFLSRRNLGEPYVNLSGVARSDCRRPECMWVWESPTLEVFPAPLLEQVKSSREARNLTSRRYRALSKLKNCIITENVPGQQAALEVLNTLDRKVLQDRERREKMDLKRKLFDSKRKNEKVKVPKTANMLLRWLKPQKAEKQEEERREAPAPGPAPEEPTERIFIEASPEQKAELERILSNLNNFDLNELYFVKKATLASSLGAPGSDSHDQTHDQGTNPLESGSDQAASPEASVPANSGTALSEADAAQGSPNQVEDCHAKHSDDAPSQSPGLGGARALAGGGSAVSEASAAGEPREPREPGIFELASLHRDVWTRFHSFVCMNRRFFVDASESPMLVPEPLNNVEQSSHNAPGLQAARHCRVFGMFDSGWKRPPMRLLVGRSSAAVGPLSQLGQEPLVDYCADSDEDWFERYDADDVELSEEEEDEEDEEEQDWIVQDTPDVREFSTGVFFRSAPGAAGGPEAPKGDLSSWARVFCLYRNWHWIVDGKPLDYELSSKALAAEHGIALAHAEFGFGFEGYARNPIVELVRKMRGDKLRLSRADVEALLKLCHGRHTRKEDLIAAFREARPLASVSEIRAKFCKYLTREKIDDRPHRWMVTPEAAKLFNIRRELDRILTQQLNEEILSEPVL